jgi:hypothetical protein
VDAAMLPTMTSINTATVSPAFSIRQATIADLGPIVDIVLAAMPMDPQWNWRFPYRTQYPEDERHGTMLKFQEFLLSTHQWVVMIAESTPEDADPRPIACAVWDLANVYSLARLCSETSKQQNSQLTPIRRDADSERMKIWTEMTAIAKQEMFEHPYRTSYIQLQILATMPQWHRKGAATALCSWGMQMADLLHFNVAVLASPMGKHLYQHLGFHTLGTVKIRASRADKGVNLTAMAFGHISSG